MVVYMYKNSNVQIVMFCKQMSEELLTKLPNNKMFEMDEFERRQVSHFKKILLSTFYKHLCLVFELSVTILFKYAGFILFVK